MAVERDRGTRHDEPKEERAARRRDRRPKKPVGPGHVPTSTILKFLVAALIVYVAIHLWTPFLVFLLAVLIAVSVDPLVQRLERLGTSRGVGVSIVSAGMLALCASVIFWMLPPLMHEITLLAENFAEVRARIVREFPESWPVLKKIVVQILALPDSPEVAERFSGSLYWGELAVAVLSITIVVFALSVYLLMDGRRMYAWLLSYVPRRHRGKFAEAMPQVTAVVRSYVRAQILTSAICGLAVYAAMSALGVPGALPLAVVSAALNVIPVIGSIVMTVPAVVLALAVSPATATLVVAFHLVYNLAETYFIVPRVFGKSLRLSTLAVLLALLVGGILHGILGAVLILPLIAAYPIIERVWLGRYLGTETVTDHKALTAVQGDDSKREKRTVDTVLRGEPHRHENSPSVRSPEPGNTKADRALAGDTTEAADTQEPTPPSQP